MSLKSLSEASSGLEEITEKDIRKTQLVRDLSTAASGGELFLLYQPIVDIVRGEIASLEALVRWNHPRLGIIEPGEFIALAESTGLITVIDEWVLDEVLSQPRAYPIHINLSTQDLLDDRFRNRIIAILRTDFEKIIIELTETTNLEISSDISKELAAVNAKLSIDDFGTGYSSMARLTALDVSSLKIDQSFVRNSGNDVESASICIAIIRLGKSLNIEVIAEGAETLEQIRFLYRNGCRLIQGYAISRPIAYEAIENLDIKKFLMGSQDKYGVDGVSGPSRVDFSTAMVLEMNECKAFLRVPLSFSRYIGYTQSELKKMTLFDLIPTEELDACHANCTLMKETGYIENVVLYLQCADNSRKCVSATIKAGVGSDQSVYLFIEPNDDDEEKIMDLQGVQGAYSSLFHEGPLATVVWRQDYEIIDWNHEAEMTFGWSRAEAIGQNLIRLLVRKSTFPDYMQMVERILSEVSSDSINYNNVKSGDQIICRWVNRAIRDRHDNVRFFISVAKDITEDLLKNDRIKQLSSAVEKSGSGVAVTDSDGRILFVNTCFSELTGYEESELIGKEIIMLSSGEQPKDLHEDLWKTIQSGSVWEGEFHNRKKDGSRYWCKTIIVPVVSEWSSVVNYIGIQKDLTAEKEQEERAGAMRTLMIKQDKLATLGSMLAGITHETYNYMASVESNLDFARDLAEKNLSGKAIDPSELLSAIEDVQGGVLQIRNMLQSLKKASRRDEKLQVENCEINNEIRLVASLIKSEYKYHASLELPTGEEITHIGYPGLLRQVIMNILINASHAIKARNSQSLGEIKIHTEKTDEWIRITVTDNGIGMDDETLKRIFEPFYTTKSTGEGTGLGLSISIGIIENQYKGRLSCESVAGVGSVFVIEVRDAA